MLVNFGKHTLVQPPPHQVTLPSVEPLMWPCAVISSRLSDLREVTKEVGRLAQSHLRDCILISCDTEQPLGSTPRPCAERPGEPVAMVAGASCLIYFICVEEIECQLFLAFCLDSPFDMLALCLGSVFWGEGSYSRDYSLLELILPFWWIVLLTVFCKVNIEAEIER